MVTAGRPYYSPLAEMDFDEARRGLYEHPMVMLGVARYAAAQGPAGRARCCSWAAPAAGGPASGSGSSRR